LNAESDRLETSNPKKKHDVMTRAWVTSSRTLDAKLPSLSTL